jgi:hypothetical protein
MAVPLMLTVRKSTAQTIRPVLLLSPPTTPWQEVLPNEITPLQVVRSLNPSPTEAPHLNAGECGRASHQRFSELTGLGSGTPTLYEMTSKENTYWVFNPAYPPQPIWGFAGNTPGPTIFARYGQPSSCHIHNQPPYDHVGFGTPEITTHLHNLHTPSESDGFPGDYYGPHPDQKVPTLSESEEFLDHFYHNILAGYDEFHGTPGFHIGDPHEALGTLWYHDYTVDFTSANVYRGMAEFYLIFDDLDSGNEHDPNPSALRLPIHPYDYPLIFQDKRFGANKIQYFDEFTRKGVPGDKVAVNGKLQPVLRVARRKYRLRLLNGGLTRFYEFYLVNAWGTASYTFTYIANDDNLLPTPLTNQFKVRIRVAERADIVVDFGRFPLGTELYLVNRLEQPDNRGPTKVQAPGARRGEARATVWPNITLYTHEGPAVTFYDDLIRSKAVAINMMYAECEGICPVTTSNLVRVQALLGARVERALFMCSLTLQPELDTPPRLKEYAALHGVQPGWVFLMGARATSSSCAIASAFSIPIRWSTVTKRRTPAWSALATTGTTAGLRRRRWPRQSRSWRRSTMWPAPAGARATTTRVAEAPGPGPGAPSTAAVQDNGA